MPTDSDALDHDEAKTGDDTDLVQEYFDRNEALPPGVYYITRPIEVR